MNTIKRPEVEEVSVSCCLCGRHCKTDCKHIAIHVVPETRITAWCRKYETCLFEDFTT